MYAAHSFSLNRVVNRFYLDGLMLRFFTIKCPITF